MRKRSLKARRDKLLREEATQPEAWWWLSFADDDGFRGAVLTRARGFTSAVQKTHDLGINPGGECRGWDLPDDVIAEHPGPTRYADRLLSKQDIDEKFGGAVRLSDIEKDV